MARVGGIASQRLILLLLGVLGLTLAGVIWQRRSDGVLRVESYAEEILDAAAHAGLEDPFLLAGLVFVESRGAAGARSASGAEGLCQLLPSTARDVAARHGLQPSSRGPAANLLLGAHYLQEQMERWDGDVEVALLSYRLGPGAVSRGVESAGSAAAYKEALAAEASGAWAYRSEVLRSRDLFRRRAAAGVGWPRRALESAAGGAGNPTSGPGGRR